LSEGFSGAALRARILQRFDGSLPRHEIADWRVLGIDAKRSQQLQKHFPADPVAAAVLVGLVDRPEGLTVLLTQRASRLSKHAAQVSFPGGRVEPTDRDIASAALREAQEEIGLDPASVRVFGYLPDHLVISGYRVTPVLCLVTPPISLTPNPDEVDVVFEVPLSHIFDVRNHKARMRRVGDEDMLLFDIPWETHHIWGATAGMLMTFVRMVEQGMNA
jgi:8-oxo-dGTP pyrophosphatase MutT (NUDIX family)